MSREKANEVANERAERPADSDAKSTARNVVPGRHVRHDGLDFQDLNALLALVRSQAQNKK